MRVAFVTNFASHYRVKTFETLAKYYDVHYLFFSGGDEWYWQRRHGTRAGDFSYEYLSGISMAGTRITPALLTKLLYGKFDVVLKCINGRFALPAAYLAARLRRRPFVLWTGIWSFLDTPFHRAASFIATYIYSHADAVVVYGEHVKRFLVSRGVDAQRIFVAAHAVDNAAYDRSVRPEETSGLRNRLGIPGDAPVVLYLGRLETVKGLGYLLQAFSQINQHGAYLVLAGAGSEQAALAKRAVELGIGGRVKFAGYAPIEVAPTFYAMADVFVLPSITVPTGKETWGLVVNEAFNQGVPVIATDAVGAAAGGLVQDGVNGFVVPERNAAALAKAITRILSDATLRDQLSDGARRTIAGWDNEQMVQGFRAAIDYAMRTHQQKSRH
ncbi:MAG: glycosyltransferase family 4 protein [Bryobacterales bacterium]|nr:glycosyltransferase family 4 protein [Bryobacterales bacterium]